MSRTDVVYEALTWLGTPYHHRARVKGVGVDCANLPAAVYESVGVIPHLNPSYSPQWMMHRDEEVFLSYILPHASEVAFELLAPGDLILWKFGRTYSHSGIVVDYPRVVHAINGLGVVVSDVDQEFPLKDRPRKLFSPWSGQE